MAKVQPPQALTANRLRTGDVLYWRGGDWIDSFADAEVFREPAEAETALKAAQQFVADRIVVNPYLFPVRVEADGAHPVEEREIIRAAGPSIHPDLGKQAVEARHV
jgi:sulfite reductase (NADPH) hemoprotein beta-component